MHDVRGFNHEIDVTYLVVVSSSCIPDFIYKSVGEWMKMYRVYKLHIFSGKRQAIPLTLKFFLFEL